jgi:radical SAM protein with 4Fe4S-binding SPASM domain
MLGKPADRFMRAYIEAPIKATFSVTDRCPLECAHCYGDCGASRDADELATGEWLRIVDEAVEAGVMAVLIEGGEPLLRTDILEILEHCRGRLMVWLRTHAVSVDARLARRIADAGVAVVLVDLFGGAASTHDRHAGVPGSFERSLAGIDAFRREGLDVVPLMILTRWNMGEVQDYLELAAALGCERAGILRLYPIGRARRRWGELACSFEEMSSAIAGALPPPGLDLMQSWHPRDKNCCWENSAVMADGRSVGCPYLRELVDYGNLRELPFAATWSDPLYRRLRAGPRGAGYCGGCEEHEGTRGGCRATAFAFTGDWDAQDPFCGGADHGIDLRVLPLRHA